MRTLAQSSFFLPIDIHLFYPQKSLLSSIELICISIEKQLGIFVWLISGFSIQLLDKYVCPSTALITLAVWSDLIPGSEPSHFVLLFHDYFSYSRDYFFMKI